MISLDKVAYTSKLLKNNPSEKLLFSILTLFSCIFFNNIIISLIVLFIMYLSITYLGGIENKLFFYEYSFLDKNIFSDLKCISSKENIWGEIDNQKQYEYIKNNIVKSLYKKEKDL